MSKANKKRDKTELVPSKTELEALKVLWAYGPSTVRFVHEQLTKDTKSVQYTSTLKMMQVMTEKGMLKRDETNMKHIYIPVLREDKTMGNILDRFVESMYSGSISNLLVAFFNGRQPSEKELTKVKELIKKLDKK